MQKVLHCRQCQYTGCEFRSFNKTASCFSGVARTTRCCSSWYLGMCVFAVFPYHTEDESVLLSYSHLWILSNLWFCDDHFEHARKAAITRGPLCDYLHLACIARHCISLKRLSKGVRQLGIYRYTFEMPRTADFEDFQYQHSFFYGYPFDMISLHVPQGRTQRAVPVPLSFLEGQCLDSRWMRRVLICTWSISHVNLRIHSIDADLAT